MIWVIIPTYNEERALPLTLLSVFQQKGNYQIIVVDGGSTDQTHNIVRAHSQIIWLTAPKGRASQMNVGANYLLTHQHTSNDWLLFHQLGGFPLQPMLEDVRFCEQLLVYATPRLLASPVVTDARKFIQMGIWRSFIRVLMIILHVEYGLPTFRPSFFADVR